MVWSPLGVRESGCPPTGPPLSPHLPETSETGPFFLGPFSPPLCSRVCGGFLLKHLILPKPWVAGIYTTCTDVKEELWGLENLVFMAGGTVARAGGGGRRSGAGRGETWKVSQRWAFYVRNLALASGVLSGYAVSPPHSLSFAHPGDAGMTERREGGLGPPQRRAESHLACLKSPAGIEPPSS